MHRVDTQVNIWCLKRYNNVEVMIEGFIQFNLNLIFIRYNIHLLSSIQGLFSTGILILYKYTVYYMLSVTDLFERQNTLFIHWKGKALY